MPANFPDDHVPHVPLRGPDFSKHKAALSSHLHDTLTSDNDYDATIFSKYTRHLSEGLRRMTLSVGADVNLTFEEKGQLLSLISMLESSVVDAFQQAASPKEKKEPVPRLER